MLKRSVLLITSCLVVILIVIIVQSVWNKAPENTVAPTTKNLRPKDGQWMTREQLEGLYEMKGKSTADLVAAFGEPSSVSRSENGREKWDYPFDIACVITIDGKKTVVNIAHSAGY